MSKKKKKNEQDVTFLFSFRKILAKNPNLCHNEMHDYFPMHRERKERLVFFI